MIKISSIGNNGMFVIQNCAPEDEKVTFNVDKCHEHLKAYRIIDGNNPEYVDKYIHDDVTVTYNALGNSITFFGDF